MTDPHSLAAGVGAERVILWTDPASGLRAICVIDDLTLGPAAGGVRTRRYADFGAALQEAAGLAQAMTLKCSISGLDAGGAKTVVMDHDGLNREAAFAVLGDRIDELGGLYHAAGDLGTTAADVSLMATRSRWVHDNEGDLTAAVADGLVGCIEACVALRGGTGLGGVRVAVQGAGAIGEAVVRGLVAAGAVVSVADVNADRVAALRDELGVEAVPPEEILLQEVDVVAPCAIGGVVTDAVARTLKAGAVCGAANNILADESVATVLAERGVLFVPDFIASAGAVIEGIGARVMDLEDRRPLLARLGETASAVLERARASGETTVVVARRLARQRIEAAALARESDAATASDQS